MTQSRLDAIREVIDWPRGSFARRRLTLEIEVHRLRQRMAASAAKRGLSVPHALQLRRKAHVRVLSVAEPVLMVAVGGTPRLWMVRTLARELRGRPAVFLLLLYWSAESEAAVSVFHREAERFRADFPDHALVFLCNTARERELFRAAGETAFFANHNMLVREDVFRPLTDVSPRFDAVYNAKLAVFKRHSLAALVAQRALVTYVDGVDMPPAASRAFFRGLALDGWGVVNPLVDGLPRPISPEDVNRAYAEARVGLCLSAEEGAMYASVEYMLAGLPVVTTPSRGGREVFIDPEFCTTVEPDPQAVRAAVDGLIAADIPREHIRASTLERLGAHRRQFCDQLGAFMQARSGLALQSEAVAGMPVTAAIADHLSRLKTR